MSDEDISKETVVMVTGATGRVGHETVKYLTSHFKDVRVKARVPNSLRAVGKLQGLVVEEIRVTPHHPEDASIYTDVDCLFIVPPPAMDGVRVVLDIVRAAIQGGHVRFIMTLAHVSVKKPDTLLARHYRQIESQIKKTGLPHCFLHSEVFMETHLVDGKSIMETGSFRYPIDPDAKFNPISCADIGAVAATILANHEAHHNKTYTLTGPGALSLSDMAEIYSQSSGKEVKYIQGDADSALEGFKARGLNEWYSKALVELFQGLSAGEYSTTSDDVATILGRPPRSFAEFVEANKEEMFGVIKEFKLPPPLEERKYSSGASATKVDEGEQDQDKEKRE